MIWDQLYTFRNLRIVPTGWAVCLFISSLLIQCSPAPDLRIEYTADNWDRIEQDRKHCLDRAYIDSRKLSRVEAVLLHGESVFEIETRLKGDWVDHLEGDQWSQRISGKQSPYWRNMQSFSIMAPKMRNYWKEWLFHKLLRKADVLATQYFFIPLVVADEQTGFWAFEEHFNYTLLENANRTDGPILRFEEDDLFEHYVKEWSREKKSTVPHIQAASVDVYQNKRWKTEASLQAVRDLAVNKLETYRSMEGRIDTLLDLDKWARFYAIVDLTRSYHIMPRHGTTYVTTLTLKAG